STFLSLRSKYKNDPQFPKLQTALSNNQAPVFNYHRFWGQVEIAQTLGLYYLLLSPNPSPTPTPTSTPVPTPTPTSTPVPTPTPTPTSTPIPTPTPTSTPAPTSGPL